MTKLIVAFSNPANVPKKGSHVTVRLKSGKKWPTLYTYENLLEVYTSVNNETIACVVAVFTLVTKAISVCSCANAPKVFYPADVFTLLQPVMVP